VNLAISVFGPDRLVLGSDWPFPMGTADPGGQVRHLSPRMVHRIGTTNAENALGRTRPSHTG
jgi:aminocarboxymuconate-semialdehyde decarboxylase